MNIKNIERFPKEKLIKEIRSISLRKDAGVFPYENAQIETRYADPSELEPSSFYVLKSQLDFTQKLTRALYRSGSGDIDTIIQWEDKSGNRYRISPPIVEFADFKKWMILDGLHRSFLAKQSGVEIMNKRP